MSQVLDMFERLVRPSKEKKYDMHIPILRPALYLSLRWFTSPAPGTTEAGRDERREGQGFVSAEGTAGGQWWVEASLWFMPLVPWAFLIPQSWVSSAEAISYVSGSSNTISRQCNYSRGYQQIQKHHYSLLEARVRKIENSQITRASAKGTWSQGTEEPENHSRKNVR